MGDRPVDFVLGAPVAGNLEVHWDHGSRRPGRNPGPALQVHAYDQHTLVLRQSKTVHFEAPFLYLLFGNERALLLDSGATADPQRFPLRATVDGLLADWLSRHSRPDYQLVLAHTHGHSDHVAADAQFQGRPNTVVVGRDLSSVQAFFGIHRWPEEVVHYDLGGRVLELTGIPGHHSASIAVYDPWSGFLITGDTVLPGRLYARDFPAFVSSLERLVEISKTRPVTQVMGCHVEMTDRPGRDYPIGSRYQPHERPLQMSTAQLEDLLQAAKISANSPGAHVFDDFIIFNGPCRGAVAGQMARALGARLLGPLAGRG